MDGIRLSSWQGFSGDAPSHRIPQRIGMQDTYKASSQAERRHLSGTCMLPLLVLRNLVVAQSLDHNISELRQRSRQFHRLLSSIGRTTLRALYQRPSLLQTVLVKLTTLGLPRTRARKISGYFHVCLLKYYLQHIIILGPICCCYRLGAQVLYRYRARASARTPA